MPIDLEPKESHPIGRHVLTFEAPDLFVVKLRGVMTPEDVLAMEPIVRRLRGARPYVLLLGDLSAFEGLSGSTRKVLTQRGAVTPYRGMALFGAKFSHRLAVKLSLSAMNLFARRDNPTYFCATEAAARAWIEARRGHLAAEIGVP